MIHANGDYLKLPGSYLFSTIAKKVAAFTEANPDKKVIRLGIGDVTQPLCPAVIDAIHKATDEMAAAETFHGYSPDLGYQFLRETIAEKVFRPLGTDITARRYSVLWERISQLRRSSFQTEQRVIPPISRRSLQRTQRSPFAIRFIRFMWTQM